MRTAPLFFRPLTAACLLGLAACSSSPSSEEAAEEIRSLGEFQSGIATYYDATGAGHCGFDKSPNDMNVAAMNAPQFAGTAVCGACAEVKGPQGTVVVRIVDSCPECNAGHLDLSRQAFEKISPLVAGRVTTTWRLVTCPVEGPVRYRIKEGSSQWWTSIQVRNHRLPVAKFEWQKDGNWVDVRRDPDSNYFTEASGMGTGPVKVRITSTEGQTLEDTLPRIEAEKTFEGTAQFSPR
ncbi:expansin EXLX1 family cellulose-binding protein [Hyalangium rubrum]|uniref:Expansin EXLX1 family cellulose-binding protein n=1 Tax=Hyalangium rubrum TaxID=3103134 RepID=A0ABU5H1Z6_9BACT|nr:expansin EXLX1 family cellulose-binding protein [Hyalangium sp. s54d21]MDY7227468.1 expansin EXLX1 family cellulose-binding protein [Hyalangium sp. s54d21]